MLQEWWTIWTLNYQEQIQLAGLELQITSPVLGHATSFFFTPRPHNLLHSSIKKIITMIIIVFLTLYIDPFSSKTNKTMIKFLTQYLQSLGQKETLHAWKHLVGKQSAFLHV